MRFLAAFVLTCGVEGARLPSKQEAETELDTRSKDEWYAVAGKTLHGVWDVQKIEFITSGGDVLEHGWDGCEAFSSGYYVKGKSLGYADYHAFRDDHNYWGGRKDKNGALWIGIRCPQSQNVKSVKVWDFGGHMSVGTTIWHNGIKTNLQVEKKAETTCADLCLKASHCCNDYHISSNQLVSCAQACMMRASGVSKGECNKVVTHHEENKGCQAVANNRTYPLCGTCKDLTEACGHGVQTDEGAGKDGCSMEPPKHVVQPGWHFAPGGSSCTTACKGIGLKCTAEGLKDGNKDVSSAAGIKAVARKLGHTCETIDYTQNTLSARPLLSEREAHPACFLDTQDEANKHYDCDAKPNLATKHRLCMCVK